MGLRINKQDDPRKDWQKFNALAAQVERISDAVGLGRETLSSLRNTVGSLLTGMHPFKIYQVPPHLRSSVTADDWRKVRVRAGTYGHLDVATGTDDVEWPDQGEFPDIADITVPQDEPRYYFWVEHNAGTVQVKHGTDPAANGWTEFPVQDADHIPIGYVDTQTRAADKEIIVRQILRTDILNPSPGAALLLTKMKIMSVGATALTCRKVDALGQETSGDLTVYKPDEVSGSTPPVVGMQVQPYWTVGSFLYAAQREPDGQWVEVQPRRHWCWYTRFCSGGTTYHWWVPVVMTT